MGGCCSAQVDEQQRGGDQRHGDGHRLGGDSSSAPGISSMPDRSEALRLQRERAAQSAEKRAREANNGLSEEAVETLKVRRMKDDLIGKIEHYYKSAGREVPFGLGGSSIEALEKQLTFAKGLNGLAKQ